MLTPCILVDSSIVTCWMSPFIILGMSGLFCAFILCLMKSVNNSDPTFVASDLGLHCLPMTFLRVSR